MKPAISKLAAALLAPWITISGSVAFAEDDIPVEVVFVYPSSKPVNVESTTIGSVTVMIANGSNNTGSVKVKTEEKMTSEQEAKWAECVSILQNTITFSALFGEAPGGSTVKGTLANINRNNLQEWQENGCDEFLSSDTMNAVSQDIASKFSG